MADEEISVAGASVRLRGNSASRLERVMLLKGMDVEHAVNYCISVGWAAAENRNQERNSIVEMDVRSAYPEATAKLDINKLYGKGIVE
jgi:hypothetical protein